MRTRGAPRPLGLGFDLRRCQVLGDRLIADTDSAAPDADAVVLDEPGRDQATDGLLGDAEFSSGLFDGIHDCVILVDEDAKRLRLGLGKGALRPSPPSPPHRPSAEG